MKLRLHATPAEATGRLGQVPGVVAVSSPNSDRGTSRDDQQKVVGG